MKFLLDQNLSHRLLVRLEVAYPGSRHVRDFDHQAADDAAVWKLAIGRDFAIV